MTTLAAEIIAGRLMEFKTASIAVHRLLYRPGYHESMARRSNPERLRLAGGGPPERLRLAGGAPRKHVSAGVGARRSHAPDTTKLADARRLLEDPLAPPTAFEELARSLAWHPRLCAWGERLRDFAQSDLLSGLAALEDDEATLDLVARRSYQHANGFAKVVLAINSGVTLRLHIAGDEPEENVHDHRWAFASTVVSGRIENVLYVDSPYGELFDEYSYVRNGEATSAQYIGAARVVEVARQALAPGSAYWLSPNLLHRIHWGARASTLVATYAPVDNVNRLLTRASSPVLRGQSFTAKGLTALLRAYLGTA